MSSTEKVEDDQMKLMRALAIIFQVGGAQNSSLKAFPDVRDEVVQLLDWISLFFVDESHGDVAALTLKMDVMNPGDVTLYVSINRGQPKAAHRKAGDQWIAVMTQVLGNQSLSSEEKAKKLARRLLELSHHRIQHKVHILSKVEPPKGVNSRTKQSTCSYLIDRLVDWQNKDPERRTQTVQTLIESANELFAINANPEDGPIFHMETEDKITRSFEFFHTIVKCARALSTSELLLEVNRIAKLNQLLGVFLEPEMSFLEKLSRRLHRVQRYYTDAFVFVEKLLPQISQALGDNHKIQVQWTADETPDLRRIAPAHGQAYTFSDTPKEYVTEYMNVIAKEEWQEEQKKEQEDQREYAKAKKSAKKSNTPIPEKKAMGPIGRLLSSDNLGRAWRRNGPPVETFMHCEIQLILFLIENKIDARSKDGILRIGVNKLSCLACHTWLAALKEEHPELVMRVAGTSGKAHLAWATPYPEGSTAEKTRYAIITLQDTILRLAMRGHSSKRSTGSDSSTGSGLLLNDTTEFY